MGGLVEGAQQQKPQFEEALGPRAQQLGGLFGNPVIAQMIQTLIQSGALQQGAGGFATAPQQQTIQAPVLQGGGGERVIDVGALPPAIQTPAGQSPVAPGTVPPSLQGDVRASPVPVSAPPQAPIGAPAPSPAVGGVNIPTWLAEIISNITAGGGAGAGAEPGIAPGGGGGGDAGRVSLGMIGAGPGGAAGLFDAGGGPSPNEPGLFDQGAFDFQTDQGEGKLGA